MRIYYLDRSNAFSLKLNQLSETGRSHAAAVWLRVKSVRHDSAILTIKQTKIQIIINNLAEENFSISSKLFELKTR